jgi:hypothetical protein
VAAKKAAEMNPEQVAPNVWAYCPQDGRPRIFIARWKCSSRHSIRVCNALEDAKTFAETGRSQ